MQHWVVEDTWHSRSPELEWRIDHRAEPVTYLGTEQVELQQEILVVSYQKLQIVSWVKNTRAKNQDRPFAHLVWIRPPVHITQLWSKSQKRSTYPPEGPHFPLRLHVWSKPVMLKNRHRNFPEGFHDTQWFTNRMKVSPNGILETTYAVHFKYMSSELVLRQLWTETIYAMRTLPNFLVSCLSFRPDNKWFFSSHKLALTEYALIY